MKLYQKIMAIVVSVPLVIFICGVPSQPNCLAGNITFR